MLQKCWTFQIRNVQVFGDEYHDTNGLNHGPVWMTQSFLLNEICTVILLVGLLWERQFEKILLEHGWEKKFLTGNAHSCTVRKDYSYLCMWMTSTWLERNKIFIRCAKYSTKKSIEENQHHSSIMSTWAVLKDIAKHASMLLTITEPCFYPEFP